MGVNIWGLMGHSFSMVGILFSASLMVKYLVR